MQTTMMLVCRQDCFAETRHKERGESGLVPFCGSLQANSPVYRQHVVFFVASVLDYVLGTPETPEPHVLGTPETPEPPTIGSLFGILEAPKLPPKLPPRIAPKNHKGPHIWTEAKRASGVTKTMVLELGDRPLVPTGQGFRGAHFGPLLGGPGCWFIYIYIYVCLACR